MSGAHGPRLMSKTAVRGVSFISYRKGAMLMKMRRVFTTTVLLLGLSVAAHADILATGAMYGGPTQNTAVCYLLNAGTGPVTVVSNQILREPNINLPLSF